jgi:hypothetical protein
MTGGDRDTARIVTDEFEKSSPDFSRGMAIIDQRKNSARVLTLCTNKVSNSVDENSCLPRTRPRQNQDIRLLTVICNDARLDGVSEAFDNRAP